MLLDHAVSRVVLLWYWEAVFQKSWLVVKLNVNEVFSFKYPTVCLTASHLPMWTARFWPIDISRSSGPWSHWHCSAQWVADCASSSSQTCTHQGQRHHFRTPTFKHSRAVSTGLGSSLSHILFGHCKHNLFGALLLSSFSELDTSKTFDGDI